MFGAKRPQTPWSELAAVSESRLAAIDLFAAALVPETHQRTDREAFRECFREIAGLEER